MSQSFFNKHCSTILEFTMEQFFAFARERHTIYLKRKAGLPRSEWTSDPVLSQFRFTNVFRELDATTVWFKENVREPLRNSPDVLLATVLFRWFNRMKTGEAIFSQTSCFSSETARTAWELRSGSTLSEWVDILHQSIVSYCGRGPYVTGAYIIKTPDGYDKLDGVLKCVEWFVQGGRESLDSEGPNPEALAQTLKGGSRFENCFSLEDAWKVLKMYPYLGDFMAYEIVTDLRHTALLENATDIMTWANPGPGAMRGLNRLHGRDLKKRLPKQHYIEEMRELLLLSQDVKYWPRKPSGSDITHHGTNYLQQTKDVAENKFSWPALEMRDIEHTLCEFDKYERARLGQGRPRGVYR